MRAWTMMSARIRNAKRRSGRPNGRRIRAASVAAVLTLGLTGLVVVAFPAHADVCDPVTGNVIACENAKPGNPSSEWETIGNGDEGLDGFTTDISTNVGGTVSFKIHSEANYTLDIYRMGYYGGNGARKITSLTPNQTVSRANLPKDCQNSADTGLIDCGSWAVSAQWAVPATAVSGIYFAHIVRADTQGDSHIVFVVRNDAGHSNMIFQTSDTTWQAYNEWGGNSLYHGEPVGRAYKVSYNRPFATRGTPDGRDFVWANEYPMVRFLEAQGYDVSYQSGVDTDRAGSLLNNHKIFMSVGHDEYWSNQQRTNVEAARDAGLNLAFFSGNEVFWKTRYEPSTVGGSTPYRTLVTYKESTDGAKSPESGPIWTGTWRDPRFSPPYDGGRPENGLTGTIFTVNSGTRAIKIPAEDGKMRFWRGTPNVAGLSAGSTYTAPTGTLGYEWDEDLDNGFRPAGAIRLSTSNYDIEEKILDYGNIVGPGNATHHLTLYRASSGALVFGAGTVQWSWGLDAQHDGAATATDRNLQQATVNLFADMGVQPSTLKSPLTSATKSTDTTAPTSTITSPAAGASLSNGSPITVTGTAADVGGQVGGVEVSVDGGQTWHPATGRTTWSYTGVVSNAGAQAIQARASDDSANLQTTPTQRQITVNCPCSLFAGETPATVSTNDQSDIELGVRFKPQVDGWVTGVRFYKGSANTGTHTGTLWNSAGDKLATGTFAGETASGWQTLEFQKAIHVTSGTAYVASYHAPNGGYSSTSQYFVGRDAKQSPLIAPRTSEDAPNGIYAIGASQFPTQTFKGGNYWVAPLFDLTEPPDLTAPVISSQDPLAGATSVPLTVKPAITFSEPIKAGTMTLKLSAPSGVVAGSTSFDAERLVATFTPAAALAHGTTYTLETVGGTDAAGNPVAATSSTFRTAFASAPGVCPCSIWSDGDTPGAITQNDPAQVELGVKFRSDTDGFISGVRFYKGPQNTGVHIGTLWSATGTQLATATFTSESSTGWQEVRFAGRVAITAGQTYVASYHTATGYYSASTGGLDQSVVNAPLTALGRSEFGGNGMYAYGARQFPTTNSGGANYWVDVVFELPPDVTAPAVAGTSPGTGATNVRTSSVPTATFSERVSGATGTLSSGGSAVPATVTLDSTGRKLTLTPSAALAAGTTYTVTVSGAQDAAGNAMTAPYSWSFTTSGADACPCTLYPSDHLPALPAATDTAAHELGVHHRYPLLQGCREHRHPRRLALERLRGPADQRHLQRGDGHRLAAGDLRGTGRGRGRQHLHRLLHRSGRPLRGGQRPVQHRLDQRRALGAGRRRGLGQRGLRHVRPRPDQLVPVLRLRGGRRLHRRRDERHGAPVPDVDEPGQRRHQRAADPDPDRDLQRGAVGRLRAGDPDRTRWSGARLGDGRCRQDGDPHAVRGTGQQHRVHGLGERLRPGRQRAGVPGPVVVPHRPGRRHDLSVLAVAGRRRPGHRQRQRRPVGRGRGEVQRRRRRDGDRPALLQGPGQHRYPRRHALERDRDRAGHGHVHGRIGGRVAAGQLRPAGERHGRNHLPGQLPRGQRRFRGHPGRVRHRRGHPGAADRAARHRRRSERGVPVRLA
jgi:hypothetical protein